MTKVPSKRKNDKQKKKRVKRVRFSDVIEEDNRIPDENGGDLNESFDKETHDDGEDDDENGNYSLDDHKQSLERLKAKDPEFYKFLLENDRQLLDFDDDGGDGDYDDVKDDDNVNEMDKDDDENEERGDEMIKITLKQIDEWSNDLKKNADKNTIKNVVRAFKSASDHVSGESNSVYKVEGPQMFNAIVSLCLIDLLPAIHKFLRLPPPNAAQSKDGKLFMPNKSKHWKKLESTIKSYLIQIINILNVVSDASIIATLLRHALYLIPFFASFPHLTKKVLRKMTEFWSEGEERVRVLAFLCLLRVSRNEERPILSFILKKLYLSYVKNCKFTTESNWSLINFMKQSLVELYSLDHVLAYQHAFIFIKQIAIQLRNALIAKKKESFKSVYNWQYLHSILLWTQLVSSIRSDVLKPLIYPLIQVTIGTIKLINSPKYFPLRFHLIGALIKLSDATDTFIPVLPLITESFDHLDYSKKPKHKKSKKNNKEMNFNIMIKVSQQNVNDLEFKDSSIKKIYDLLLHYFSTQSHRIGFPELVHVHLTKIRKFIKSCTVSQHSHLIKQLVEKTEENSKMIVEMRKNVTFSISDINSINSWERECKEKGTPLTKFYEHWKVLNIEREKLKVESSKANDNDEKSDDDVNDDHIEENVNQQLSPKDKGQSISKKKRKKKKKITNRKIKIMRTETLSMNEAFDLSSDDE